MSERKYDFWIPTYKWEFVGWFVARGIMEREKAERMSKKQLAGKYIEMRKDGYVPTR